jgi:hypothetical protein
MPRSKTLAAILVVLPATILLTPRAGLTEPTDGACRTSPDTSAPQGTHWYYRVNPADKRHCWYLKSEGLEARSHVLGAMSYVPSSPPPQQANAVGTDPVAPSQAMPTRTAPVQAVPEPSGEHTFAVRWSDLSKSLDVDARKLAGMSTSPADKDLVVRTARQTPTTLPDVKGERAAPWHYPSEVVKIGSGFLLAALLMMVSLLFFGVWLIRRHYREAAGAQALRRLMSGGFSGMAPLRSVAGMQRDDGLSSGPMPTDPAIDLKKSLQELMCDLRRTDTAGSSLLSFAPSTHQMSEDANDLELSKDSSPSSRIPFTPRTYSSQPHSPKRNPARRSRVLLREPAG